MEESKNMNIIRNEVYGYTALLESEKVPMPERTIQMPILRTRINGGVDIMEKKT